MVNTNATAVEARMGANATGRAPRSNSAHGTAPRLRSNATMVSLCRPALAAFCSLAAVVAQEPPSWEQLDARPLPRWFDEAKFGIFIHWGVYSVPAYCDTSTYSEWYQHWLDTNSHQGLVRDFHARVYGQETPYRKFAEQFRCELWQPDDWASTFRRAGADYVVITSKHHDGFALWPDAHTQKVRGYPWNALDTGPKRDLLGELCAAVRRQGLRFGLYYSFLEWHNPLFGASIPGYVEQQMLPQVKDLVMRYQPDVFWPDGEWEHPATTWRGRELLHWLRTAAPNRDELVVNDRWGKECRGEHGDYYTTEYGGHGGSKTHAGQKPFEECRGIGRSFAFNRAEGYDAYLSRTDCVRTLIDLVSRGGKLLLDIGPAADGTIPLIMTDRLYAIGDWLRDHGDAIRGCKKSPFRNTPWGRATTKGGTVYLHVYEWPKDGDLVVRGMESPVLRASLLRDPATRLLAGADAATLGRALAGNLAWWRDVDGDLHIDVRGHAPSEHATVVALQVDGAPRCEDAWHRDAAGVVTLPARDASIKSAALRMDSKGDLVSWTSTQDRVDWGRVRFAQGVEYEVQAELAFADGEIGGDLDVFVGDKQATFSIAPQPEVGPGFHAVVLGRTASPADGAPVAVSIAAVRIAGKRFGSLRALRFAPVGAQFAGGAGKSALAQGLFGGMLDTLSRQILARASLQESPSHGLGNGTPEDFASAFYGEDAVITAMDGEVVRGRKAIGPWLVAQAPRLSRVRVLTTRLQMQGDGSFVQFGRYALDEILRSKQGADSKPPMVGEFVRVWRRVNAGVLQIVSETWWN